VLTVELKRDTLNRFIQWLTIGYIFHKYRGPAYTYWHYNGQKSCEEYLVNERRHRNPSEGPAVTVWYNGRKDCEEYWKHGKLLNRKDYPQC